MSSAPRVSPAPRRRAVTGCAAALALGAVTIAGPLAPATAAPGDDPRVRAVALAAQVRDLRAQAEAATETYDNLTGALAAVVGEKVTAQVTAQAARVTADASTETAARRARALYESGGPLSLYAGVLGSGDVGGLTERLQLARAVTAETRAAGVRTAAVVATADAGVARVADATRNQAALERTAAEASLRVTALLAAQEQALADADLQVRQLAEEEEARRRAADEAAFAASLASAYAAAGQPLIISGVGGASADGTSTRAVEAMAALIAGRPPYVWGGTGPIGYDCSGLVLTAYRAAGLALPRTAAQQWSTGQHPPLADLRPGDLLFWGSSPATIHHVAMYAGGGLMWSTNHTGDFARLQPIWGSEFIGATRPAAA